MKVVLNLPDNMKFIPLRMLFDENYFPNNNDWYDLYVLNQLMKRHQLFNAKQKWQLIYKALKSQSTIDKESLFGMLEDDEMLNPNNIPQVLVNLELSYDSPILTLAKFLVGKGEATKIVDLVLEGQLPAKIFQHIPRKEWFLAVVAYLGGLGEQDFARYVYRIAKDMSIKDIVAILEEYFQADPIGRRAEYIISALHLLIFYEVLEPQVVLKFLKELKDEG